MVKLFFCLIVGGEHAEVEHDCPDHGGDTASPESCNTFFFDDSGACVEDIIIVSSAFDWEGDISLHSDEDEISWVSGEGTNDSGGGRGKDFLDKWDFLSLIALLEFFEERFVGSEGDHLVADLSGNGRVESGVEPSDSSGVVDILDDLDGVDDSSFLAHDFRLDLDLDFEHISRLDDAGGNNS